MSFHVGQKVCCVDVEGNPFLALNAIYTIRGIWDHPFPKSGKQGVWLAEVMQGNRDDPFYASRFRPIVSRKTDIAIFKRMLLPQGVDA